MEVNELRRELVHSYCEIVQPYYRNQIIEDIESLDRIMLRNFGMSFNLTTLSYE